MKKLNIHLKYSVYSLVGSALLSLSACNSFVPDDLDALGDDIQFTTSEFTPYLGRTIAYENVVTVSNSSTLPLNYEILDIRDADGQSLPNLLTEKFPVRVWQKAYTGEEKSIEEILNKQIIEYRSPIEMQQKSGDLVFWHTTSLLDLQTMPYEGYTMDVGVSNTGGQKIQRGLKISPMKPRAYEPSQYDASSGLATNAYLRPSMLSNIVGERTGNPVHDIKVYVNKDYQNTAPGNTLTVSVVDSLNNIIDIQKFNQTTWEDLVHGFNHKFVEGKVVYDVLYPMPLINYPTKFTDSSGQRSRLGLRYTRLGKGGFRQDAVLLFDFSIYEEGHWEIQFRFAGESPKFDNE